MLFLDAPDHGRLRSVVQGGFCVDVSQRLAPAIHTLTANLLDGIEAGREFDFMQRIARPLPARVIGRLMGLVVDDNDQARFDAWTEDLATFIGAPRPTVELARRAQASLRSLSRLFEQRLSRGDVDDASLLGRLVAACAGGQVSAGPELLAQCAMLLFGGYETTRNLLGNALFHLLSRPLLWLRLQREPGCLSAAIRELLRFDSPVQYTGRRVTTDVELHGRKLRRGDLVVALIAAANRDPRCYPEPDTIDLARRGGPLLSFGSGPHVCVGAGLSLLEAEAVLGQVVRKLPRLKLSDPRPDWNRNAVYRGLATLRVSAPFA
jgi:cytochrome P450